MIYTNDQNLPFADNSINTVLFLDVMEHLPFPDRVLRSIKGSDLFLSFVEAFANLYYDIADKLEDYQETKI